MTEPSAEAFKKAETLMAQALRAHQHGKFLQAQALYKDTIKIDPGRVAAFHLLGLIELQLGHFERAVACIREAIRQNPKNPAFHASLGMAMRAKGHLPEAKDAFNKVLSLNPKNVEVLNALGAIHLIEKNYDESEKLLKTALEIKKDYLDIHINLGSLYLSKNMLPQADESFRKALQINPRSPQAHFGLAKIYMAQSIARKAVSSLELALSHEPNMLPARLLLAEMYEKISRLDDAESQWIKILEKKPDSGIYVRLGQLYSKKQDESKAMSAYKRAIELKKDNAQAYIELGKIYFNQKKLKQAISFLFHATQLPDAGRDAFYYLGLSLIQIRKWREAIAALTEASKSDPTNAGILGELMDAALHNGDFESAESASKQLLALYKDLTFVSAEPFHPQLALHIQSSFDWQLHVAKAYAKTVEDRTIRHRYEHGRSNKKEVINLGYISPYFGDKYAGLLMRDLLVHHNRKRFKVFLYNTYPNPDAETFAGYGLPGEDTFRNLNEVNDRSAAERIYKDGINILIDLGGLTRTNRLDILSYQPAPVQCLMAGYPSTSGASFYQCFITSKANLTSEEAKAFPEKVLYLPDTPFAAQGFYTPEAFLLRKQFNLPEKAIVLCNFQKPYHLDKATFTVWAKILKQTENTVLWLQANDAQFEENVKAFLKKEGIDEARIIFSPPEALGDRALYTLGDIMLESLTVASRVNTVMALWSALPVVALLGNLPQSRLAASLVLAANAKETVANDVEEYINIVGNLCKNPDQLTSLRTRLLKARGTSSLFNANKFILSLDEALRGLWDSYNK